MKNIFVKNAHIKYASNGICLIEDIISKDFSGTHEPKEYFVLRPLSDFASTIFVPADNEVLLSKMSRILTKDEVDSLISDSANGGFEWIEDRKQRREHFDSVLSSCDQTEYLRLISCLYIKQRELNGEGKRLTSSDEAVLKQAEKSIENEFSFILDIPCAAVGEYIAKKLASAG